jgi:hypothetical protein
MAQSDASDKASKSNSQSIAAQERAVGERLAFDKQQYADGAGDRAFASATARTAATNQAEDRTKYNALQDEQIARGRKFQGAEDQMLVDSQNYDTDARRESEAQKAQADVNKGFASADEQSTRAQDRRGVNPNSGASAALEGQKRLQQAMGLAGAANTARKQVETQGYARKMDAIGLGKGLVGNQATQASLQLQAGNSSVANSLVPVGVNMQSGAQMSQGYGNAASGYSALGANQANSFYAAQNYGSGVGKAVGGMFGSVMNTPGVTNGISSYFNGGGQAVDYNGIGIGSGGTDVSTLPRGSYK